jgi:hypothetical protein
MNLARLGPLGAETPVVGSVEQGRQREIEGLGRQRHELVGGPR